MTVFIIIFMCFAMLAAVSALLYVIIDIIMEVKGMDSYAVFWNWLKSLKLYNLFRKKNDDDAAEDALALDAAATEDVVEDPEIIAEETLENADEAAEAADADADAELLNLIENNDSSVTEINFGGFGGLSSIGGLAISDSESAFDSESVDETATAEAAEAVEELEEIVPEIVEHIDAEIADTLMSDRLAMKKASVTKGAGKGKLAIINLGDIDPVFEPNSVVDIAALKENSLISKKAGRLKILADGTLNKPLTVKAESYSVQAIKMIELTGGEVIILKD